MNNRSIPVPPKREVQKVYYESLSCLKVAEHFGVCKKTALKWMKGYGIHTLKRNVGKKCIPLIRHHAQAGIMTAEETARALGINPAYLYSLCKKAQIPLTFATKFKYRIVSSGYVRIRNTTHPHASNGYVAEHRLVVEKELGRYLEPTEHVHHIDEDKQNNVIGNLQIMTHSEHATHHGKILCNICAKI